MMVREWIDIYNFNIRQSISLAVEYGSVLQKGNLDKLKSVSLMSLYGCLRLIAMATQICFSTSAIYVELGAVGSVIFIVLLSLSLRAMYIDEHMAQEKSCE